MEQIAVLFCPWCYK